MNLSVDIYQSYDASTLYIEDISTEYGAVIGAQTYLDKSDITSVDIIFKQYKSGTTGDVSDNITSDITLNVPVSVTDNQDIIIEIESSEVNSGWSAFPEGIYYIQYKVYTNNSSVILPDNNTSYVIGEVLYSQTKAYYDALLLNMMQNLDNGIEKAYYYDYTVMFCMKYKAFTSAIELGNLTYVRSALAYLQDLMETYPSYNDTRIF